MITTKQQHYQDVFDALMDIAMTDKNIPKELLENWDNVADYIGDIASGRQKGLNVLCAAGLKKPHKYGII